MSAFDLNAEGSLAKLIKPFMKNSFPEMSEERKFEFEQRLRE